MNRFGKHIAKLLADKEAAKLQPKRPGRPSAAHDWSHADLDQVQHRIRTVRTLRARAKSVDVIRKWDAELRLLLRRRGFLNRHQRSNRRALNGTRTQNARIVRAEQRRLEGAAKNKDSILSSWMARDFYRFPAWCVTEPADMRPHRFYRPLADWGYCLLTDRVIRAAGFVAGDCTRDSRNLKNVRRYDGEHWREVNVRDLATLHQIVRVQPTVPEKAKPESKFNDLLRQALRAYPDNDLVAQIDPQRYDERVRHEAAKLERLGPARATEPAVVKPVAAPEEEVENSRAPLPAEPIADRPTEPISRAISDAALGAIIGQGKLDLLRNLYANGRLTQDQEQQAMIALLGA